MSSRWRAAGARRKIRQIRVEASLDASKYVESANQKAAADETMIAGDDAVKKSRDETQRRLTTTTNSYQRDCWRRMMRLKAAQQLAQAEERLNRLRAASSITEEQLARQLQVINDRYAVQLAAAERVEQQQSRMASF